MKLTIFYLIFIVCSLNFTPIVMNFSLPIEIISPINSNNDIQQYSKNITNLLFNKDFQNIIFNFMNSNYKCLLRLVCKNFSINMIYTQADFDLCLKAFQARRLQLLILLFRTHKKPQRSQRIHHLANCEVSPDVIHPQLKKIFRISY